MSPVLAATTRHNRARQAEMPCGIWSTTVISPSEAGVSSSAGFGGCATATARTREPQRPVRRTSACARSAALPSI